MENIIISLNTVLPIFLTIGAGYAARQLGLADKAFFNKLNKLVFLVFLPVLLFMGTYQADIGQVFSPRLLLFAVGSVVGLFLLLLLVIPLIERDNPKRGVLIQGIFRSNFVILGLPVATSLYGDSIAGLTTILVAVIVPLYNVLSVMALELFRGGRPNGRRIARNIVTNPLIIASLLGVAALYSGIKLPVAIERTLSGLGDAATPIALLTLGGTFEFGAVAGRLRQTVIGVAGRLIVVPGVLLPVAVALGFRGMELTVLISMMCVPTAVSSYTMAQQLGGDGDLAGQLVVFGSSLSVFTLFGWIYLAKSFGFI